MKKFVVGLLLLIGVSALANEITHENCEVKEIKLQSAGGKYDFDRKSELIANIERALVEKGYYITNGNQNNQLTVLIGASAELVDSIWRDQGGHILSYETELGLHQLLYNKYFKELYILDQSTKTKSSLRYIDTLYNVISHSRKRVRKTFRSTSKVNQKSINWAINKIPLCRIH